MGAVCSERSGRLRDAVGDGTGPSAPEARGLTRDCGLWARNGENRSSGRVTSGSTRLAISHEVPNARSATLSSKKVCPGIRASSAPSKRKLGSPRFVQDIHVYNLSMEPIHRQVLEAARRCAGDDGRFAVADVVRALPHLDAATVRTHVASRCCVNAPAHHASRHPYFRAVARGIYRLEAAFRHRARRRTRQTGWQDRVLAAVPSSVDPTLIAESLRLTPTERLEASRHAAMSLESMTRR